MSENAVPRNAVSQDTEYRQRNTELVHEPQSDDFSREQVPEEQTYTGLHIALIVVGGTIGMSVFVMAAQIGGALGLSKAAQAFAVGCLILGSMGMLTSLAGQRTRLSTYMLADFTFGRSGAKLVNLIIALSLIGWYGIISNVFGQVANTVLEALYDWNLPVWGYALLGSVLMIGVTLSGFKGIDNLALFLVPLMLILIAYAAFISWGSITDWHSPVPDVEPIDFSRSVSVVVGIYIAGVIIQPDYSRFARNAAHAIWSAFIALGIVFPVILFLSAVPAVAMNETDLIKVMLGLGIGLPAFLLVFLGSWSSNVLCLYSTGLSLSTLADRLALWKITLGVGIVGTMLALIPTQDYFIDFLILLGVSIPPIGAIYVIDALLVRQGHCNLQALPYESHYHWRAFLAWAVGVIFGYLTINDIVSLTSIASTDSIVLAGVVFALLNIKRLNVKKLNLRK